MEINPQIGITVTGSKWISKSKAAQTTHSFNDSLIIISRTESFFLSNTYQHKIHSVTEQPAQHHSVIHDIPFLSPLRGCTIFVLPNPKYALNNPLKPISFRCRLKIIHSVSYAQVRLNRPSEKDKRTGYSNRRTTSQSFPLSG